MEGMEHAEEPGRRGIAGECPSDFAQGQVRPTQDQPRQGGRF